MPLALDLEAYAAEAETFVGSMDREYYLHFAGHKRELEIAPIYDRHRGLFTKSAVEELRGRLSEAEAGDDERRARYLLELAVGGFMGEATKAEETALAEREAALEIEVDGQREPYRQASISQANEPDPDRRAQIERARLAVLEAELNPLHVEVTKRTHELAGELGWTSYRAMCEELKAVDLGELEQQTGRFLDATATSYRDAVEPQVRSQLGIGFDALRRSDLPYFFRAPAFDSHFPEERLLPAFEETLAGLGIDLHAQANVRLDTEQRPQKSPRAFCSPVQVPHEVYLVIPRTGGRDDFAALFHEGGHTEHYANVDASLPFEFRHLGDNSVTEGFAFLLEHLTEDATWLRDVLGVEDADAYLAFARASKFVFLRRYAAKLGYELELHGGARPLAEMPALYARDLSDAVGVDWPAVTYLSDVDPGYYVANYLRAWAFETHLRGVLRERFGEDWFAHREAGDLLRSVWGQGQRLDADELLAQVSDEQLDFGVMLEEVRS
jgi:hypothetical protein